MPAAAKFNEVMIEQLVARRAGGESFVAIGRALGVSDTSVARRIRRDPQLARRIAAETHLIARRQKRRGQAALRQARADAAITPDRAPGIPTPARGPHQHSGAAKRAAPGTAIPRPISPTAGERNQPPEQNRLLRRGRDAHAQWLAAYERQRTDPVFEMRLRDDHGVEQKRGYYPRAQARALQAEGWEEIPRPSARRVIAH